MGFSMHSGIAGLQAQEGKDDSGELDEKMHCPCKM